MSFTGRHTVRTHRTAQWVLGVFIVLSGAAGQFADAMGATLDPGSNAHLGFGVLLSLGVACRFRYGLWRCGHPSRAYIMAFARQLTRSIYVLMYALLLIKLMLSVAGFGGDKASAEAFRPYLISGIAAILLTRALASGSIRLGLIDRPVVRRPSARLEVFGID